MKKKILIFIIVAILFIFSVYVYTVEWDNLKLRLVRFWGFATLQNNPLLENFDKDFKMLNKEEKEEALIPVSELLSGGVPKDGIPSIDNPIFVDANDTVFGEDEIIVGVYLNGEARAYPYGILNWHEIINDKIGDTPITVTLCPLCDTNPVFVRIVNNKETTFGVSGKLYQSCLVMYDRMTDSLWSQPLGTSVLGDQIGKTLEKIPSQKTTLGAWIKKYPNTKVLSTDTGVNRDYFNYPYGTYYTDDALIFPVKNQEKRKVQAKEIESYISITRDNPQIDNITKDSIHVTHKEMKEVLEKILTLDGKEIVAKWDQDLQTVRFFDVDKEIPSSTSFGFVYPAFFE